MATDSILIPALFILIGSLLCSVFAYWQERREGYSHEASLTASLLLTGLLLGTSVVDYFSVAAKYS